MAATRDDIGGTPSRRVQGRLQWTVSRLRAMTPRELGFRLRRKMQGDIERAGIGLAHPSEPTGITGRPWVLPLPRGFDTLRYTRAADRILDGRFDVFALEDARLGFPPRWNVDPKTGIEAPLEFGFGLDYRDAAKVGDIKYLWEINRHLELVTLAQAWHLTADERYAQGARVLVDSWLEACPYPKGANWCASLEHAIRLVNWSFAWQLLGADGAPLFAGEEGRGFRGRWLEGIHRHCHFIARHFSRHSSANNHLMGEATGLFIGALTWPLWPESGRWLSEARAELTREALLQTFEDGVNREQAVWYHHAVADMLLIAGLFARANGCDFDAQYWGALEAMLDFLASIMDVSGGVPAIGDADQGVLARLAPAGASTGVYRSLLATGAVLFGRAEFRLKAGELDDKTRWLLGDTAATLFEVLETSRARLPARRSFPCAGYYILGDEFETAAEVRIVADAGSLGYLAIAAHGHADALAFTLTVGGSPFLVDSGTFAYHTESNWRRYFRGTSAHNTLVVDGEDQSLFAGPFLWLRHAEATVDEFLCSPGLQVLVAHHDGYRRLADPVLHRRTWRYDTAASMLTISDELGCSGTHTAEIFWHFAPECQVASQDRRVTAERDGLCVELEPPESLSVTLVHGRDPERGGEQRGRDGERPLGWVSSGFDLKAPATTAVFAGRIGGNTRLESSLRIRRGRSSGV
ncbi:MAG TPA: alginate lyase family protein [Steroidobacteraceae bacterium]|nr:alginate lyase family protein [Steroidobacteraceae bacterium]